MMRYPFDDLDQFFDRMSRGFGGVRFDPVSGRAFDVDVSDHGDALVVTADLPGYETEDIDVSISERALTVSAHREHDHEEGDGDYIRRERHSESVRRSIPLAEAVREEDAEARYRNGVLTVRLPKVEASEAEDVHHIDVE